MTLSTLAHASPPQRLPSLPWEIVVDIICRLPPKSLMRFRAVASLWRAVIDSPEFVKMHFSHTIKTQSHRGLILGFLGVYSIDLDKLDRARVLKPPFSSSDVSNSCNGLVLLLGQNQTPFLWNPSTKKYKALPDSPVESPRPGFTVEGSYKRYGFGYIPEEDDYKVLRAVELRGVDSIWLGTEAKIYSLKSNSWRKVGSYPYPIPRVKGWGVHVNGACHTVLHMNEHSGHEIVAVDLRGDRKYIVPKPDLRGVSVYELSVLAMEDFLCLIVRKKRMTDIWIMKEYGKKESWSKLLSIGPPDIEQHSSIVMPLTYSDKGDEVLLNINDEKLIWYNLEKKMVREVQVDGLPFRFYAEAYVQTLIPLENGSDGGGVGLDELVRRPPQPVRNQEHRKMKQIRNKRDAFLSQGFKLVL